MFKKKLILEFFISPRDIFFVACICENQIINLWLSFR